MLALDASGGSACEFASALVAYGRPAPVGEPLDHTSPLVDEYGNECAHLYELEGGSKVKRDAAGNPILRPGVQRSSAPVLSIAAVDGFTNWSSSMGFDDIVSKLAAKMRWGGASVAIGDGYLAPSLESEFRRHGLWFVGVPTSNTNKSAAMKHLRLLLGGRQLLIDDADTRSQLCNYRERISASGLTTYAAASGSRSDRVSVILNALIGEAEGHLPWSPSWAGNEAAERANQICSNTSASMAGSETHDSQTSHTTDRQARRDAARDRARCLLSSEPAPARRRVRSTAGFRSRR